MYYIYWILHCFFRILSRSWLKYAALDSGRCFYWELLPFLNFCLDSGWPLRPKSPSTKKSFSLMGNLKWKSPELISIITKRRMTLFSVFRLFFFMFKLKESNMKKFWKSSLFFYYSSVVSFCPLIFCHSFTGDFFQLFIFTCYFSIIS